MKYNLHIFIHSESFLRVRYKEINVVEEGMKTIKSKIAWWMTEISCTILHGSLWDIY